MDQEWPGGIGGGRGLGGRWRGGGRAMRARWEDGRACAQGALASARSQGAGRMAGGVSRPVIPGDCSAVGWVSGIARRGEVVIERRLARFP